MALRYHVYFDQTSGLGALLESAIQDYNGRYGRLPDTVVVHSSLKEEALGVLAALKVQARVSIKRGMLITEVWLPVPDDETDKVTSELSKEA